MLIFELIVLCVNALYITVIFIILMQMIYAKIQSDMINALISYF